jgi:hypothetical protein
MIKPRKTTKKGKVSDLIEARNPLQRLAVKPVNLYPVAPPPVAETHAATEDRAGNEGKDEAVAAMTQAAPPRASGSGASPVAPAATEPEDKVVAYGTYIRASQRTGIKLRAAISGRDSYEIIQDAIDEYFENHPVNPVS